MADPEIRLVRPRQLYTGPTERPLVPVEERRAHQPLVRLTWSVSNVVQHRRHPRESGDPGRPHTASPGFPLSRE